MSSLDEAVRAAKIVCRKCSLEHCKTRHSVACGDIKFISGRYGISAQLVYDIAVRELPMAQAVFESL